jgi:hypothetical protein
MVECPKLANIGGDTMPDVVSYIAYLAEEYGNCSRLNSAKNKYLHVLQKFNEEQR